MTTNAPAAAPRAGLTTEELAHAIGLRPSSIRVRLCTAGHYFGLRPTKLPNGRLLWPADAVEQLKRHGSAPRSTPGFHLPPECR